MSSIKEEDYVHETGKALAGALLTRDLGWLRIRMFNLTVRFHFSVSLGIVLCIWIYETTTGKL